MLRSTKTISLLLLSLGTLMGGGSYANESLSSYTQDVQRGTATGTVVDDLGPVIGATVMVKGTRNGTITDENGRFSLSGVQEGDILYFSCIGYLSQEVSYNFQTSINITLKEEAQVLGEVMVVGYGTQKKVNVTGAVSMVGSEVFESRPVSNVTQALQGAIPGLNLTTTGSAGDLNSPLNINIRGTGSLSSSDSPLVLIDGIEGDLSLLNPNDIESISVLKDAASASIYGSRAAFGVILVTTRSGKEGKVRVNYSGDVRFSTATQLPKMVDSYRWALYFNEANSNAGSGNYFSDEIMDKILRYQAGEYTDPSTPEYYGTTANTTDGVWYQYANAFANTDWFAEFYKKNVPSTQHNVSVSGGTEQLNWLVSGSFLINNGLIRHGHDELDRYNLSIKLGAQLASWIRLDYSSKWTRKDYQKPQYLTGLFFHNIARRWPTNSPIDPNGNWSRGMEIAELEEGGVYTENNDLFTQQVKFTLEPIRDWSIYVDLSLTTANEKYRTTVFPVYYYDIYNVAHIRDSDYGTVTWVDDTRYRQNYYTVNIYTDYVLNFDKHHTKYLVGVNYELYEQDTLYGYGENLTTQDVPYLSQAQSNLLTNDSYWHRATAGLFGRINYDYDEKYLFEANLRYDGSSRFVGDKRWALFPSFSVGWNIAREDFFSRWTDQISMLKLRTSWGQLGNTSSSYSSFSDWYPFFQQMSTSSSSGTWLINGSKQNTASLPSLVSSLLTWETIETYDVGLDWAALNNRLTGSADWFVRTTRDMVGPASTFGSVLGTSAPQENNCDMRSIGWELEVSWRDQIGSVRYGARLSLSDSKQTILSYPNEIGDLSTYYAGMVLGEIWGYTTHGIANSQEEMDAWLVNNTPNWGSNWSAGDIMYTDLNGDGVVNSGDYTLSNHGDLTIIGNTTPRYRIGFNFDVEWKGIDFSIFFQGVMKRDWTASAGDPYFWGATGNVWQSAAFEEHMDYWTTENTDAYYPKPYFGSITKNQQVQTRYIQSAAYLRCKNVQLGYTLPRTWTQKAKIENCRIYISCDNAFTLTKLSSVYDPEALGSYGDAGYTSGKTYPLQRTFAVGISLNF